MGGLSKEEDLVGESRVAKTFLEAVLGRLFLEKKYFRGSVTSGRCTRKATQDKTDSVLS